MYISRLCLQNYRCYDNFEIDFNKELTVIVAENGKGKTAILDAVAVALGPYLACFDGVKANQISDTDVRQTKDTVGRTLEHVLRMKSQYPVVIGAEGVVDGEKITWKRELKAAGGRTTILNAKALSEYGRHMVKALREVNDSKIILPVMAYYGTSRMWKDNKLFELRKDISLERGSGYVDCMEPSSSYNTFGQWFKYAAMSAMEFDRYLAESGKKDEKNPYTEVLKAVRQAIITCIGSMGWTDIDYSFAFQNLIIMHETMGVLPLEALSDGTRSVISMAADLAYRMVRLNPDLGAMAALETPGIVLIDEVDMHLHPSWQQAVVYDVRKAFPNVQFIVTTHSPQVLSTVPAEAIRILRWDNNLINIDKPAFSLGAESFQLLKDIQNVDTRPQALPIVKDLYRYLMLVSEDKWDTDEARELRKRLDEWSKGCELAEFEDNVDDFRVEHFFPKVATQLEKHNYHLDWHNLLGVCHGGSQPYVSDPEWRYSSRKNDRSCDVPKGGKPISERILNPLKIPASVRLFRYQEHTGKMIVDESSCPKKLQAKARNTIRELNLNAPRLQRMRLALIRILEDEINSALAGGAVLEEFLPLLAESILLPDEDGNYQPFFSVARWYLGEFAEDILRENNYAM